MHLSEDFFDQWEHIINDVDKSDVPVECIERLVIKLFGASGSKQKTINVRTLRKNGCDSKEIEDVINRHLTELNDDIRNVDFYVDLEAVADIVGNETEEILKKL